MTLVFWLIVGHAITDYPLQGDFLARGKNHHHPLAGIPWQQCLLWHAVMHGGAVAFITGSVWCGLGEIVMHMGIDYLKCDGRFGFNVDQALHVACKLVWVAALGVA